MPRAMPLTITAPSLARSPAMPRGDLQAVRRRTPGAHDGDHRASRHGRQRRGRRGTSHEQRRRRVVELQQRRRVAGLSPADGGPQGSGALPRRRRLGSSGPRAKQPPVLLRVAVAAAAARGPAATHRTHCRRALPRQRSSRAAQASPRACPAHSPARRPVCRRTASRGTGPRRRAARPGAPARCTSHAVA